MDPTTYVSYTVFVSVLGARFQVCQLQSVCVCTCRYVAVCQLHCVCVCTYRDFAVCQLHCVCLYLPLICGISVKPSVHPAMLRYVS